MKTELTEEEINSLLLYAGTRPQLYNKIMNIAYKKWGIILPPVNVMVTMQIVEDLELWRETCEEEPEAEEKREVCNYFKQGNGYCMAQRFGPVVYCGGDPILCSKED